MLLPPPTARASRLAALAAVVASALFAASPAATASSSLVAEGAAPRWDWPLDGVRAVVRPYVAPATPYGAGHRGVDIGASDGTRVLAPDDGIVHFAGVVVDRPVLSLRHQGGLISSFEPVTTDLMAGEIVRRGEQVGTLLAGHCSRPCVHFGVRLHGEYLSPLLFLGGIPHSVLLPTRAVAE